MSGVLEADFGEGCTDQPRNLPAIVPLELALVDDDQNHERKYDDHEPHIRMPFAASERSPYRRNLIFGQGSPRGDCFPGENNAGILAEIG